MTLLTCGNELVSCGNDLLTCGNELVSCGNDLLTCGNELVSCGNDLLTCGNELVLCGNELLTCGNEFVSCGNDFLSCGNDFLSCGNDLLSRCNKIKNARKTVLCPFRGSLIFMALKDWKYKWRNSMYDIYSTKWPKGGNHCILGGIPQWKKCGELVTTTGGKLRRGIIVSRLLQRNIYDQSFIHTIHNLSEKVMKLNSIK